MNGGGDFIKIDDISRPINKSEIKAFSEPVKVSGREMVISLSPGLSSVSEAEFLGEYANMWRISNDIWDSWHLIRGNFDYCTKWFKYSKPGTWPDADMLPIGRLRITRGDDWVAGLLGTEYGKIWGFGGDWSSSNESVATVDTNGFVLAIDEGTAIITATTQQNNLPANCTVNVTLHGAYTPIPANFNQDILL